jgi:hypothetical protein
LGFSKKLENLEAACAVFLAFYNFVWRTRDANNRRTRLPAAMTAGIIDELWDFERLYDEVTEHTYAWLLRCRTRHLKMKTAGDSDRQFSLRAVVATQAFSWRPV